MASRFEWVAVTTVALVTPAVVAEAAGFPGASDGEWGIASDGEWGIKADTGSNGIMLTGDLDGIESELRRLLRDVCAARDATTEEAPGPEVLDEDILALGRTWSPADREDMRMLAVTERVAMAMHEGMRAIDPDHYRAWDDHGHDHQTDLRRRAFGHARTLIDVLNEGLCTRHHEDH